VATVIDGFEEADVVSRFNAEPGINLTVFKSADQDAIEISKKVQAYVAGKMGHPLERNWLGRLTDRVGLPDGIRRVYENAAAVPCPPGGRMQTSTNLARFIEGRLDLLMRNGAWGLTFVFLSLLIFLNWRVALWVMMGLLLSILGTLIVMNIMGLTLNLVSMFGLIIVLGLLVDDAIIVGEHVFTRFENGMEPKLAAVTGTEAVTWPVVCTIITTIVAFAPLLFIKGVIGDFMGVLPVIVMCALIVSLFECLSILPAHLATALQRGMPLRSKPDVASPLAGDELTGTPPTRGDATVVTPGGVGAPDRASMGWARAWAVRFRTTQNLVLRKKLLDGYEWLLRRAVSYRYVTMAALATVLIIALGFVIGGRVPVVFVQKMDSETLLANLKMPVGAPIDRTDEAVQVVERAAMDLPELESMYTIVGMQYNEQGGDTGAASHLGQIIIELKSVEQRERTSEDILRELRSKTVAIPGMNSLKFNSMQGGPGGAAIQVEITGGGGVRESDLVEVADHIKSELQRYAGVFDIEDDFDAGRREIQIELLESARALGITTESLATQVRAAFYGLEARKIQRRREDVKIMVRYPESARRRVYDVESMWIATPDATLVPFSEVARLKEGRSYASIKRKNQERTVTVTADVDQAVGNSRIITADLARGFSALQRKFPGIQIEFGGQAREFARSFSSLRRDFVIAGLLIYVILAALFKSYVQPLIVMATIPFGLIGAVAGHYVMGYPLTMLSLIGLVALTGIVVNDSL
ncbi:MAG: efflux RND transporter permease subunit, partial [Planctomycetes bacterium]|nr:efflux RND transporter permease subunit [Planctomycetota bacterium]